MNEESIKGYLTGAVALLGGKVDQSCKINWNNNNEIIIESSEGLGGTLGKLTASLRQTLELADQLLTDLKSNEENGTIEGKEQEAEDEVEIKAT